MSDIHTHEQYSQTTALSPGEQLQRQREQLNISVEEAADALHLRPAVIVGLEQDNYEEIPVLTYRRGYLRAYAKYLKIDETPILDAYMASHGSQEPVARKAAPLSVKKPPSRIGAVLFKLVTLAVILGLIAVTVMWWQSRGGITPPGLEDTSGLTAEDSADTNATSDLLTDESTPTESAGTAMNDAGDSVLSTQTGAADDIKDMPTAALPDSESTLNNNNAIANSQNSEQPAIEETASQLADSEELTSEAQADEGLTNEGRTNEGLTDEEQVIEDQASEEITREEESQETSSEIASTDAADENTGEANSNRLEFTFNQQSWTEIYDASNQRVFVGLQEPGTSASVDGEPPYRLTIGNSTGVELRYQGEVVDLGERAGANNVARFTLGE